MGRGNHWLGQICFVFLALSLSSLGVDPPKTCPYGEISSQGSLIAPVAAREPIYALLPKVSNFPQQHRAMLALWINLSKQDPTYVRQVERYLGPEAAAQYWANLMGDRIPVVFLKRGAEGIARYHAFLQELSDILAKYGIDVSQTRLLLQGSAGFVGATFHQKKIDVVDGKITAWKTFDPVESDVDFVIFFQNPKDLASINQMGLRTSPSTFHIKGSGDGNQKGLMDVFPELKTLSRKVSEYLGYPKEAKDKVKLGSSVGDSEDTMTGLPAWGSELPQPTI